jgi:hypothetical protein
MATKAIDALRAMSLLARELTANKDLRPHKLATLKTSLKCFRDLISGAKLLIDGGIEADLSEVFFGTPVAFTHVLDSEDHGFSWLLRAKNLLTVGSYNANMVQTKAKDEISSFSTMKQNQVNSFHKLARRKVFEENVDFLPKKAS